MKKFSIDNISETLKTFSTNQFDPTCHPSSVLADGPGNYIICLRKGAKFPATKFSLTIQQFKGHKVIYTGISSLSLKNRDFKQHFNGTAGRSTLRKSIGVLLNYKLIPRDKNPLSKKTKFNDIEEQKLTKWMYTNLLMYFLPTSDHDSIENILIAHFNPPLNLKQNGNPINSDFRQHLSFLRNNVHGRPS